MAFLLPSETRTVEIRRFNPSNPKGLGFALHEELLERTQIFFAAHPDPPLSNKAKVFANWKRDYMDAQHTGQAWQSCEIPESSTPPAFVRGVLSTGNRRYFSAAIQLSTGHDFTAEYSIKFRPGANDNIICPCSRNTPPFQLYTRHHVLLQCPLFAEARAEILGNNPTLEHIFQTEAGGRQLARFLHATQALLRPLPPRPDPP